MLSILLIRALPSLRGVHSVGAVFAGLLMMIAGFIFARRGLAAFSPLRQRLAAVRKREASLVEGLYPTEVQPLVDELNALLAEREKAVERAQRTAADLAHELKTPLALLMQEAERLTAGNPQLSDNITRQVERMTQHVNYHLARARAAASGSRGAGPSPLAERAAALLRTMSKLHAEKGLTLVQSIPPSLLVRVQQEDLDEMLGNLLDNACKWACGRVSLSAERVASTVEIVIEDDGPGIAPDLRARVLGRGVRADQSKPGSGLGLAIVRDLAELYGGAIHLSDSPLGGLKVRLLTPGA
ncbi:MAG: sensor histidine kinase [Bryobacterales bacterium]|nr:sensor histidine kinase [Bryobacterales bacterium]